ncbi:acyl-CoA dehydrogenase [Actinomadura sp. LD22]|uniref:Acyl-CoA dehydrogenase n=1 Tax=Actinomadura physcomitrii TaxID=2650748 RepID=A0A6I4M7U6_9ACTN|nr:acyl-CoA dehydrogenase family protein [Actinomadura physcomitrii]MVZ99800.1 acyl-CoA dehydrogenase [Actinomadura physcomitrii]
MTIESIESFRGRARTWLAENMPRTAGREPAPIIEDDSHEWQWARELQKKLYAGGFAGICFPKEYGGLGLTPAHQQAFNEESEGYEMPLLLNSPTFSICAPTLLDMGSEEQKRERIGAAIRGEEIMCQFLSEPGGGSDLAGVRTRADRDGDHFVLNGAKIWSTSAYAADWGLCLARTDWDVPKHHGLTMFLVSTRAPGVTINRIRMVNGNREFCEEFFDNVRLPLSAVVGEVGDGWRVASQQLYHERTAMGGGSPYTSGTGHPAMMPGATPVEVATALGRTADPRVREMVGEYLALNEVAEQTSARVTRAIEAGDLPPTAASLLRLLHAEASHVKHDLAVEVAGAAVATGVGNDEGIQGRAAIGFLMRQSASLGGGSDEMSRNVVSERVLGMPREPAPDRGVPFKQVRNGR